MVFQQLLKTSTTRWPWVNNPVVWCASLLILFNFIVNTVSTMFVGSVFLTLYGATSLPYLYVVQAVLILMLSLTTSAVVARYPRQFILYAHLVAIALIILGQFFLAKSISWFPFIVCIVVWSIAQVYSINTANFLALVFNLRQFKDYNSIYTSFGTLLGASFAFSMPIVIHDVGVDRLPWIMLIVLVMAMPIFKLLKFQNVTHQKTQKQTEIKVQRYPLFNNLLLYLSIAIIISTLIDYCFKFALNHSFNGTEIASFLAVFNGVISLVVFALQISVTKKLMRILGVVGLLLILPIATIFTVVGSLSYPSLVMATVLAFVNYVVIYAMTNISREIILNVLPTMIRLKAKTLIKGITVTVGTLMAAGMVWIVSRYFGVTGIEICLLIFSVAGIYFSWRLQKNYKNTLRQQLILKRFKPEQILAGDSDVNLLKNLVETTLKTDDVHLNFLGFSMLPRANFSALPKEVLNFISSPHAELRVQAIKATKMIKDPSVIHVLQQRMESVDDPKEKFYLLEAIYAQDVDLALYYADRLINDAYPRLKACAIDIQIKHGDIKHVALAITMLRDMIEAPDPLIRASSAEILGDVSVGDLTQELMILIADPNDIVALNAIRSVVKLRRVNTIPALVARLGKGIVGFSASKALQELGIMTLPALQEKVLNTSSMNVCAMAIKTIASIDAVEAEATLIAISNMKNLVLLHQVAKYSAYRAQKMTVSAEFLKHADTMLNKECYNIQLLKCMLLRDQDEFYKREIVARLRLAQKGFLYWLAIVNDAVEMLPIVTALCANAGSKDTRGFNYAIELLETSLKHSKYAIAIKQVFEKEVASTFSADPLHEIITIDPWLGQILSTPLTVPTGGMMDTLQIVMTLRNTNLFESLPGETLLAIAEVTKVREVTKGEVIYSQGELPSAVYIIANGECCLTKNDKVLLQLKMQDCFGFIGVFENTAWDVTATAVTDGVLLYLEKAAFDQIIEDVPEVMQAMMFVVLGYLKQSLQKNLLR